ncbi:MAG TPA: hypothetical protein VGB68_16715 [Pyrinomonadaceae bacterium]|jgi:uncharacterized protein (TIGR02646 family)
MISIKKPKTAPKVLQEKGKTESESLCQKYEDGEREFEFNSDIYGHKEVKEKLIKAQKEKCFLCESRVRHISYGDVEHFRPKAAYCQDDADEMHKPGYYWLAYNWKNLFLACQICNQRFKKNLFPLEDNSKRVTSHSEDINQEKPLFINPVEDNPEDFISFRGVMPFAINGNLKGQLTIENAGLKRPELVENRRELYGKMKALYNLAHGYPETPQREQAMRVLKKRAAKMPIT